MTSDNPWLRIPAADYEAHMGSPEVGQLAMLSEILREQLRSLHPRRVLIAGCATGNGLELTELEQCARIVGIDINPMFLEIAGERHKARLPQLELVCRDHEKDQIDGGPFDLIYAGLLFEYVDPLATLKNLTAALSDTGVVTVVLQLAGSGSAVTKTRWESLKILEPVLRLREPAQLHDAAIQAGLQLKESHTESSPGKKQFQVITYVKAG